VTNFAIDLWLTSGNTPLPIIKPSNHKADEPLNHWEAQKPKRNESQFMRPQNQ